MTENLKPPPTLACKRVLEYAILDDSVTYSGHSRLFRGDKEVGPVPRLAITEGITEGAVHLLHCDSDWEILGTEGRQSPADAKAAAEETYRGVSALWVDAGITQEDAANHLDEIWGPHRCRFCGKTPLDSDALKFVEKNGAAICETCIRTCYDLLQQDDAAKCLGTFH